LDLNNILKIVIADVQEVTWIKL